MTTTSSPPAAGAATVGAAHRGQRSRRSRTLKRVGQLSDHVIERLVGALTEPEHLGKRDHLRTPRTIGGVDVVLAATTFKEERDREQFGEHAEGSLKWTIDCERDVPGAVSDLKMPFDQFRSAREHVSRRERDAADRRDPGGADAERAGFQRRSQRAST